MTQYVTRFDTREIEDGWEVRFFEKRVLLGKFSADEITREEWEDGLKAFITEKPRTYGACEAFLIEQDSEDAEDEEDGEGGSIVPAKYRIRYGAPQNCGDDIAIALTSFVTLARASKKNPDGGLDRAKLRAVAEINGIGERLAAWEDRGLNGGLLRMNTSNVLRGMNRKGLQVIIGDEKWPEDTSNPKHPEAIAAAKTKRTKAAADKKAADAKND